MSRRITLLALVAALVAAGCSDRAPDNPPRVAPPEASFTSAPPAPSSFATATPTGSIASPECANQAATVGSPSQLLPGSISGDVNGDGTLDQIHIALDRSGPPGCQAFLVAQTASGSVAGTIATWTLEGGLPQPRLHSVAQINGNGGDDVVVDVAVGASAQFASVLVDEDGVFLMLSFEKEPPPGAFKDMFAYGGSVGHADAVDCAPGGGIVVSSAIAGGNSYRVSRRFFSAHGASLKADPSRDQTTDAPFDGLARFPEFPNAPFGNCPS